MPCTYYTPEEEAQIVAKELDQITGMLCGLCRAVERGVSDPISKNPALKAWWNEHKKVDTARRKARKAEKKRERVRNRVLERLTPEEREVLGLRD